MEADKLTEGSSKYVTKSFNKYLFCTSPGDVRVTKTDLVFAFMELILLEETNIKYTKEILNT